MVRDPLPPPTRGHRRKPDWLLIAGVSFAIAGALIGAFLLVRGF